LTDIAFHFNVTDRLSYVCRLVRKAVGNGAKVMVIGSPDLLVQVDSALWAFTSTDFVPHCTADADPTVLAKSPVVLATSLRQPILNTTLLNLGDSVPDGFEQFERMIEVVTFDESDRQCARSRWKHYADAGFKLTRHDLQKASA
jgi:DNA polymerase-3 subunit chi